MSLNIQRLFIYPVKSLQPVQLDAVELTDSGLRFDRSFALIYVPEGPALADGTPPLARHLTIKKTFGLALFQPQIDETWTRLTISHVGSDPSSSVVVPLTPSPLNALHAKTFRLSIFGTMAAGIDMGEGAATFFTQHLGSNIRLVFIGGNGYREIPGSRYARNWLDAASLGLEEELRLQHVKFADAAPLLITSTASEREARGRLRENDRDEDIILRFRPNIHIDVKDVLPAYDEDSWHTLSIRTASSSDEQVTVNCVYQCVRCLSINADLSTGGMVTRDRQLYGLLARDRRINEAFPQKPVFGQYAFAGPLGAILRIGDEVSVVDRRDPR